MVIRSGKSKDRQRNGQKKKDIKGQTIIYRALHRKLKIAVHLQYLSLSMPDLQNDLLIKYENLFISRE